MAASERPAVPPSCAVIASADPSAIVLAVGTTLAPANVATCTDQFGDLLGEVSGRLVVCDVGVIVEPDVGTVDALARLALCLRRSGCHVRLRGATPDLRDLLALAGLGEIVPCDGGSVVEAGRQSEHREELRSIEEERDPPDPIA